MKVFLSDSVSKSAHSFVGGLPLLPERFEWPISSDGNPQTFFFQVEFPVEHVAAGEVLAVFACTTSPREDTLIPEMIDGPLRAASVTSAFLRSYQRDFCVLRFPLGSPLTYHDGPAILEQREIVTTPTSMPFGSVGGLPDWLLENEAPGDIDGDSAAFLMQLDQGITFRPTEAAPRQMVLGLDGTPEPSSERDYRLFLSNAVYIFGIPGAKEAYVLTQV